MATSVLLTCELNEQKLPPFVFVREEIDVDGSFIITSILGQRSRIQNSGTILICFHQTFQHYAAAGMRLGFNLNSARQTNGIIVIEPFLDIAENLFESDYLNSNKTTFLEKISSLIHSSIETLAHKQSVTIIIDNVGALLDLGLSQKLVLNFCEKLTKWTDDRVSVLIKLNTSNLYPVLCSNLNDWATAEIQICKLKSGNFKQVDGKLIYTKKKFNEVNLSEKTVLYKVNDRNIKVFVPGEVGAK